jgi:hypothetical protein
MGNQPTGLDLGFLSLGLGAAWQEMIRSNLIDKRHLGNKNSSLINTTRRSNVADGCKE